MRDKLRKFKDKVSGLFGRSTVRVTYNEDRLCWEILLNEERETCRRGKARAMSFARHFRRRNNHNKIIIEYMDGEVK